MFHYVAVVVYGMKEPFYFDYLGWAPVSRDTSVCRRFDIGVNNHFDEIPFFTMTEGLQTAATWQSLSNVL